MSLRSPTCVNGGFLLSLVWCVSRFYYLVHEDVRTALYVEMSSVYDDLVWLGDSEKLDLCFCEAALFVQHILFAKLEREKAEYLV